MTCEPVSAANCTVDGQELHNASRLWRSGVVMSTSSLRAWPHPRVTKPAFLRIMGEHREQDRIIAGHYWRHGRGCAVGCSLETVRQLTGDEVSHSTHSLYAKYLGVPEAQALLEDSIFESLSGEARLDWPIRFAEAIVPGADLSGVVPAFLVRVLREIALPAATADPACAAAVERVAAGLESGWQSDDAAAAWAAGDAARTTLAARAAWAASTAAMDASNAGDAAWAANTAAGAAGAAGAVWGPLAVRGAWAAWVAIADMLISTLAVAPVPPPPIDVPGARIMPDVERLGVVGHQCRLDPSRNP